MTSILGESLLHLRKARGLTQKKLAQFQLTPADFLLGLTNFEKIPTTPDAFLIPPEPFTMRKVYGFAYAAGD